MTNVLKFPMTLYLLLKLSKFRDRKENGLQLTLSPEDVREMLSP